MDLYCCWDLILLQADMSMAVRLSIRKLHRPLQWRHNGHDGVSYHQPHHCLLNRLFSADQRKYQSSASLAFCDGNSPVTGEFPAQMASNAENVYIWRRHHALVTRNATVSNRSSSTVPWSASLRHSTILAINILTVLEAFPMDIVVL